MGSNRAWFKLFKVIDEDNSGRLSYGEFFRMVRNLLGISKDYLDLPALDVVVRGHLLRIRTAAYSEILRNQSLLSHRKNKLGCTFPTELPHGYTLWIDDFEYRFIEIG